MQTMFMKSNDPFGLQAKNTFTDMGIFNILIIRYINDFPAKFYFDCFQKFMITINTYNLEDIPWEQVSVTSWVNWVVDY